MDSKKPSICFVAQNSYGALTEENATFIGGVEIQVPLMARWFADRGYPVTMICWDEGFGEEVVVQEVKVIALCRREAGIPGLRFLIPRWTSLISALRKASPDVIYYNYGDQEFGQIVLWAKKNKVPVLYSVANNEVCLRSLPSLGPQREKLLYRFGLQRADKIIVQTQEEKNSLLNEYGLKSELIPMPNPGFQGRAQFLGATSEVARVLWVGRFTREKRLEWLIDIAEQLPDVQFDVIGGASIETEYAQNLVARAHESENITLHGKMLRRDMARFYCQSTLLCSTSSFEGFPNVFLEAWSVGLPVVATVDPDGIIGRNDLGGVGTTVSKLVDEIRTLLDSETWSSVSENSKNYYDLTHKPDLVMNTFEDAVLQLHEEHAGRLMNGIDSVKASMNPSLCLIAHNAYGVLAKQDTSHVGGIEVQVPMMSKWFARRGYQTTMIAWDKGYPDGIEHEDVTVRKLCKETDGIPFIRFVYPRWTSLIGALRRADSDVYYYNCGDMGLGQVVFWAHLHGKKVVYSIANDVDCVQELPALKPLRERFLYKYGLMRCDEIICQTEKQKRLLEEEFGLSAQLIRMPCDGFDKTVDVNHKLDSDETKHILWAGRFTPEKRLEYFFELAKMFPDMIFDVIGDFNFEKDTQYADSMKSMAESLENVVLHGRIPHEKMGDYFNKSYLLCSTSVYEGFPNIYLEAWSVGLPLVTTFDPDGVVEKYGCGRTASDVNDLRDKISELLDVTSWRDASEAAESYFEQFHTLDSSMLLFEKVVAGTKS